MRFLEFSLQGSRKTVMVNAESISEFVVDEETNEVRMWMTNGNWYKIMDSWADVVVALGESIQ